MKIRTILGLTVLASWGAFAQQPAVKPKPNTAQKTPSKAVPAQGMVVVKDAETGALRAPTAAEAQFLQQQSSALASTPGGPTTYVDARGGTAILLDDSALTYTVATRDANGKIRKTEVMGAGAANKKILAAPSSTVTPKGGQANEK